MWSSNAQSVERDSMLRKFLDHTKETKQPATYKTYNALLLPFSKWLEKNGSGFDSFTVDNLQSYLNERNDWTVTTGGIFLGAIKSYCKYAIGRIPIGVTEDELRTTLKTQQRLTILKQFQYPRKLSAEKKPRERVESLSIDELKKFFKVCEYCDLLPAILLCYFMLRKGELLESTHEDKTYPLIDYKNMRATFRLKKVGFRTKTLYFNDRIREILEEYSSYAKIKCDSGLNSRFARYDDDMGFRVYPHMLRKTANTHMRKALAPIYPNWEFILKALMGHSQEKNMTDLYTDPKQFESEMRDAMVKHHFLNAIKI